MEIERGDLYLFLIVTVTLGYFAVLWAYRFMKRRQARIVSQAIHEMNDALAACSRANERLTEEAGTITSNMLDLVVAILVYLVSPQGTPEGDDAFAAVNLALEGLSPESLKETRDRLSGDAKALIEEAVGQTWDQLIEDSETKPSSKGHETIGGNGDYF